MKRVYYNFLYFMKFFSGPMIFGLLHSTMEVEFRLNKYSKLEIIFFAIVGVIFGLLAKMSGIIDREIDKKLPKTISK